LLPRDLCQAVTSEYDEDGFLLIFHDAYGEKKAGVHPGEAHWPGGLFFRPRDADADNNANHGLGNTVWQTWEGNQSHIEIGSDPRAVPKLPRLKKGGSGLYGDTGKGQLPYVNFDGDSGSFTLYVPYDFTGDVPGKAMSISIDVASGTPNMQLIHGSGCVVSLQSDGSVSLVSSDKGSSVTVSAGGNVVVNGNTSVQGAVLMGDPSTAQPVALATLLQAYLTLLESAVAAGIGAVPGGQAGATAFTTAVNAAAAAKAAIAAILTKAA
jgi:hypothetical protein